jgi:heptosyltransferase-1
MKILIVKLSSLGDVVHTLPVVQDLLAAFPTAQIDWVLEPSFAPVLAQVQGLHRVIPCALRRWRRSFWTATTRAEWRAFKTDLQRDAYDAVLDLQGLTKSAVVARLARLQPGGQRYAMANPTEGSGYEAPTRWLADVAVALPPHIHAVARGRALAAQALAYSHAPAADFGLNRSLAHALIAPEAINKGAFSACPSVVLVHGTSRADKEWPLAHWVALGQRLEAAGLGVALAHGSAQELATSQAIAARLSRAVVWPMLPLDGLTAALAGCCGVVGVDSGVSHIAVALGLAHVQIYNVDTAWRTGPDPMRSQGRQVSVFAQPTPPVDAVWQAWLAASTAGQA